MVTIGLQGKTHYNKILHTIPSLKDDYSDFIGIISCTPDNLFKIQKIHHDSEAFMHDIDKITDIQILPDTNLIIVYSEMLNKYYKIRCRNMEVIRNLQDMKRIPY